ncbi:MAG: hypothetical protein QFF03_13930 [Pseudomonadota bacterium]|nr:hypothetical protein [Pseudomonadota bacterium]
MTLLSPAASSHTATRSAMRLWWAAPNRTGMRAASQDAVGADQLNSPPQRHVLHAIGVHGQVAAP